MVEFEKVFNQINPSPWSPFPHMAIWFISITQITTGGVPLFLTFLTSTQNWRCLTDRCSESLPLCQQNLSNADWEATVSKATDNFLKNFQIQCGYEGYISIVNSLYFVAFMVGISIGGNLLDRFGRKKIMIGFVYLYAVNVLLHSASKTDFRVFALFHTTIGMVAGMAGVIFIYQQELTVGRLRNFGSNVFNEAFSVGMLYGAFLSYYFADFTTICLLLLLPAVIFATAMAVWLPESPFWLQSNDRKKELHQTLKYIAEVNRVKFDGEVKIDDQGGQSSSDAPSSSLRELFTFSRPTTRSMLILLFAWLTASYSYWGLSFNVGDLIGNLYLNQLLIALIDLINRPINYYGVERFDRKKFLRSCNLGMVVSAVICMVPYEAEIVPGFNLRKIAALAGRMLADLFFSTIYLYTSEVLPTVARATGLGTCSCVARIGSVLSPFVIIANKISPLINFALMLVMSAICFFLFHYMPETKGKLLPHNMKDMQDLVEGSTSRNIVMVESARGLLDSSDGEDDVGTRYKETIM